MHKTGVNKRKKKSISLKETKGTEPGCEHCVAFLSCQASSLPPEVHL